MSDERVVIFIDGSNFYHCLKADFNRANLDYSALAKHLCSGRHLVRIYYYSAAVSEKSGDPQLARRQQQFFYNLQQVPYLTLRLGRVEPRPGGTFAEKGVDVRLVVDMLVYAYRNIYDTAILISGDADFVEAVQAVQELGKHVENAFGRHGMSYQLRNTCDRFIELTAEFLQDCWR